MARSATAAAPTQTFSVAEQRAITQAQLAAPGEAPGRPQDFLFQQRISTMRRRLENTRTVPATVINFLPSQLMVNSSMPACQVRIPGCSLTDEYTSHTWHEPIIEVVMADSVRTPNDYVPRQIAEEYVREYNGENSPGGVMLFDGSREEFDEALQRDPKVQATVEATKQQAIEYMKLRVNEAESAWNTPDHRMASNITELHRTCAARLEMLNVMGNSKPEWMDIVRSQKDIITRCVNCKAEPKPGANSCTACGYIINPAECFKNDIIDEHNIALERLTRAEVEALGISDYVAETKDERAGRLAGGKAKPMSKYMQRLNAAAVVQ